MKVVGVLFHLVSLTFCGLSAIFLPPGNMHLLYRCDTPGSGYLRAIKEKMISGRYYYRYDLWCCSNTYLLHTIALGMISVLSVSVN